MSILRKKESKPIFKTSYLGFWIRVYPNRVDFKSNVGKDSVPISQIASVQSAMIGKLQITIETTGGKRYKIPCLKKKASVDAIYKAQSHSKSSQTDKHQSTADELLKLSKLRDRGILSSAEFESQKNKLI